MRISLWLIVVVALWFAGPVRAADDVAADLEGDYNKAEAKATIADPIKPFNKVMYTFNDKLYFWVLKPAAKGWGYVVPEGARVGLKNMFTNLRFPIRLVSDVLTLRFKRAGQETGRFVVNTTIGGLGYEDAADTLFDLKPQHGDFGTTFAYYGAGPGCYIVWPFLGPSSLRDSLGMGGDYFLDPINYVGGDFWVRPAITAGEVVNKTSTRLGQYEDLKKNAVDPYTFLRDVYHQNREKEVHE